MSIVKVSTGVWYVMVNGVCVHRGTRLECKDYKRQYGGMVQ